MASDKPQQPKGRPPGTKNGESAWRNYMYEDEAELYDIAVAAIEKAKSDMKGPLNMINALRTRCFNRIHRERKRGEQE